METTDSEAPKKDMNFSQVPPSTICEQPPLPPEAVKMDNVPSFSPEGTLVDQEIENPSRAPWCSASCTRKNMDIADSEASKEDLNFSQVSTSTKCEQSPLPPKEVKMDDEPSFFPENRPVDKETDSLSGSGSYFSDNSLSSEWEHEQSTLVMGPDNSEIAAFGLIVKDSDDRNKEQEKEISSLQQQIDEGAQPLDKEKCGESVTPEQTNTEPPSGQVQTSLAPQQIDKCPQHKAKKRSMSVSSPATLEEQQAGSKKKKRNTGSVAVKHAHKDLTGSLKIKKKQKCITQLLPGKEPKSKVGVKNRGERSLSSQQTSAEPMLLMNETFEQTSVRKRTEVHRPRKLSKTQGMKTKQNNVNPSLRSVLKTFNFKVTEGVSGGPKKIKPNNGGKNETQVDPEDEIHVISSDDECVPGPSSYGDGHGKNAMASQSIKRKPTQGNELKRCKLQEASLIIRKSKKVVVIEEVAISTGSNSSDASNTYQLTDPISIEKIETLLSVLKYQENQKKMRQVLKTRTEKDMPEFNKPIASNSSGNDPISGESDSDSSDLSDHHSSCSCSSCFLGYSSSSSSFSTTSTSSSVVIIE